MIRLPLRDHGAHPISGALDGVLGFHIRQGAGGWRLVRRMHGRLVRRKVARQVGLAQDLLGPGGLAEARGGRKQPVGGVGQEACGGKAVAAGEILGLAQGLARDRGHTHVARVAGPPVPGEIRHGIGRQSVQRLAQLGRPVIIAGDRQRGVKDLVVGNDQRDLGVASIRHQLAKLGHLGPEIGRVEGRNRSFLPPHGGSRGRIGPFHEVNGIVAE